MTYTWVFTSGSPANAQGSSVDWAAPDSPGTAKATLTVSDGKKNVTKTWEITVKTTLDMEVAVQLVKLADNTPYAIEKMNVVLEDENGMTVSAQTDSNGKVVFPVTERGTYKVVRVEGLDVTGGVEGAAGLEFVKENPLSTSAPKIAHVYSVCPVATLEPGNEKVEIQSPIPTVRRVTILKKGSVDTPDESIFYYYASGSYAGRMIISNRNCDCNGGLYVRLNGIGNFMLFNLDQPAYTGYMTIYNDFAPVLNISSIGKISDTLTIEIPGNGDWAFTSNDTVFTRTDDGLNNSKDSFVSFGTDVLNTYNFGGSHAPPDDHYRFDYEFQKFEEL